MNFDSDSILGLLGDALGMENTKKGQTEASFNGTVLDGDSVIKTGVSVDDLHIPGSVVFLEDVDAEKCNISGRAEFRETASFGRLAIVGNTLFKEELMCESLLINETGTARVHGKISSDAALIDGTVEAVHKVSVLSLSVGGKLYCNDSVHSDKILVKGLLTADKEVRCIDMRITSSEKSEINKIRAEKLVTVCRNEETPACVLVCDEADVGIARLQYAKIDSLICDSCHIGAGCVIGCIECRGSCVIDEDAVVNEIKQ